VVEKEDAMTALTVTVCHRLLDRRGVLEVAVLLGLVTLPAVIMFIAR
jgi:hypothetical protein